jgi:hypothetical protein
MKFSCPRLVFLPLLLACAVALASAVPAPQTATRASATDSSSSSSPSIDLPGPLRSAMRMAAISQKASLEEVLPLLARNIAAKGYTGWKDHQDGTEFLSLLQQYFSQAEELTALAGKDRVIRVRNCAEAKPLLDTLGYRLRQACGDRTNSLETAEPERAFLTVDSAFPLTDLEEALRTDQPFSYPYEATRLPILFTEQDWIAEDHSNPRAKTLLDALLANPNLARLYWAMARMDAETRTELKQTIGLDKLVPQAPVLDFYGGYLRIRAGRVMVPGGPDAEDAWKVLVGASPEKPSDFVPKLVTRDEGWLAAYFDAVSRVNRHQQAYFTDSHRIVRLYDALRGRDPSPGPARPVFRSDPGLFLLMARLELDSSGQPHIPGDLNVWQQIVRKNRDSGIAREWSRRARNWSNPEQLVDALVGLSRVRSPSGPLQLFLTLTEMDRGRFPEQRLTPTTVRLLAEDFDRFRDQYKVFVEFHSLDNESISRFLRAEKSVDNISDSIIRANAIGMFQASLGLWQILARQGEIPERLLNNSFQKIVQPYFQIDSSVKLFDAAQIALNDLLHATGSSNLSQSEVTLLLAGPNSVNPEDEPIRQELAARIRSVMAAQRLVSLDTILALGSGLHQMAAGKDMKAALIPLAEQLREFELPRPLFTSSERLMWATGMHTRRHAEEQIHTDLTKVIRSGSPKDLAEARGRLAPFLRDTMVGLNYAYYEPPGAHILHHNALFVRSHDFSGDTTLEREQSWRTPQVFGAGMSAGGGAHLVGSLADLPYVLASAEQDFLVPENEQALIWQELVPTLMTGAVLPRWWGVTRNQLRAVTLYQKMGEQILLAAANDAQLRPAVMEILADGMVPQRAERVELALQQKDVANLISQLMPSETFFLASEFRSRFPEQSARLDGPAKELDDLTRQHPEEVSLSRLSEQFGAPHPVLTQSYARELLHLKPLPAFMGYASRLLAESWDSNNLYWARLADEKHYAPAVLNTLVPELTHRMVEKIFATDFEDWPALLRALLEAGDEFRRGELAALPPENAVSRP